MSLPSSAHERSHVGDRPEVVLGVLMAHASPTFPQISAIVLNGGLVMD